MKRKEPGILALAELLQIPYETFPAEALETVDQPVEESEFVLLAAGEHSRLVVAKQAGDGITVAVAAGWRPEP